MELPGSRLIFNSVASCYDTTLPSHIQNYYCLKRAHVIRSLGARGWICSVAGGTGALEIRLQNPEMPVLVIDSSFEMCKVAKSKKVQGVVCADATALPIKGRSVALCFSVAAFHHIVDKKHVELAISEMARITVRGGSLVIWDHNGLNPYWKNIMARVPQDTGPTRIVPFGEFMTHLKTHSTLKNICSWRCGWMPDFAPAALLFLFSTLEWVLERTPIVKNYSAHNVFVAAHLHEADHA